MIAAAQAGGEMFLFACGIHGCAFQNAKIEMVRWMTQNMAMAPIE